MPTNETWRATRRRDGLVVAEGLDGWIVIPADGDAIDRCPCCKITPTTQQTAMRLADVVFPLPQEAS